MNEGLADRRTVLMTTPQKYAECKHCTYKLVAIAYQRTRWFRFFREPLILGIRFFVWWHHVDVHQYVMKTPACNNCIRFYKTALFRKSASFRWLHSRINPIFNSIIPKIVTEEEHRQAKTYAEAATAGTLSEAEIADWMRGLKHSL